MGVPKRRKSHARQGDHRAHHALVLPQLEECPHCHQAKQSHHVCPNCGWYNGRLAIHIRQKSAAESAS